MTLSTVNTVPTAAELQSYKIIAEVAANNPYWRKLGGNGTPEMIVATILSVMLLARELGISPIQAISGGINNIQGKFEISARLMNQLIRKHGHKIAIKMSTNEVCIIWSKRKDTGEEHEEKYHIEEAIRSGLIKEGSAWKKVPTDMLFARCISRLARRLYADCIGGCYIEGELQEEIKGQSLKPEDINEISQIKGEFEIKSEPIVALSLPSHISQEECDLYIQESSERSKVPIQKIKERASKNMGDFVKAFDMWKCKKNFSSFDEISADNPVEIPEKEEQLV